MAASRASALRALSGGAAKPIAPAAVQPGDALAILYTSGTTGPAKGVVCPHAQYLLVGREQRATCWASAPTTCCAPPLPLFHINALNTFAQAALTGAEVVFVPRFSASGFWPADAGLRRHGGLPAGRDGADPAGAAEGPGEREHRVRTGLGARRAGLPRPGLHAAHRRAACSKATARPKPTSPSPPRPIAARRRRDGLAAAGLRGAAWPTPTTPELPDGEAGELLLRADEPFAFASGYFNMPEKTVEAWRNLWFHTGDRVVRERRRRLPLRRPHQGRDPPARREHLLLRGRAGAAEPSVRWRPARSTPWAPSWPRTR